MAEHRLKARQQCCSHFLINKQMKASGFEHFCIELLESYPCSNVEELRAKEGEHIRRIGTLIEIISGGTSKMYVAENYAKTQEYC